MKFGSQYQEALRRGEYPQEWIDSAISYKKLKKCIKRVQQELADLGLDRETLEALWQHAGFSDSPAPTERHTLPERMMHYEFLKDGAKFVPILRVAIDPRDGSPMDAWLSPETRRVLRKVGRRPSEHEIASLLIAQNPRSSERSVQSDLSASTTGSTSPVRSYEEDEVEVVEIPLTSDSEFFQILRKEIANLEKIEEHEKHNIQAHIEQLGKDLQMLKTSKKKRSQEEIEAWRQVFQLYTESQIFMSSHERDAGIRDAAHADQQMKVFLEALASRQEKKSPSVKLSSTEASVALDRFIYINTNLLRLLQYQEMNGVALTKIMKKFDKRTALHAQTGMLQSLKRTPSAMTRELARATCFTISDQLLTIIPQLDDYLCPVCFSISWKPVRLRCNHIFCIRCLIVLQRAEQDHCPLCREEVVLEATGEHIDKDLLGFLKKNFRPEIKQKQRENDIAAGIDRWGEQYAQNHGKCVVM